ncbi:MAG: hypothetical protein JRD89_13045 [Deltaproteobacteria bacterium]|nr:hypothetical protein [Deltaproteobacteria bacterium]
MPRWKYKTSIVDLDSVVPPESISCNDVGVCIVDGIPGDQDSFKGILDKEVESEWELAQCQAHGGKLLCIWKKEAKEAFAS